MLDRETILGKKKLRREVLAIPEWDGEVIVRELRGDERAIYESGFSDIGAELTAPQQDRTKRWIDMRAKIVVLCTINDDGEHVFRESDIAEVNQLSGAALDRIFTAVMR